MRKKDVLYSQDSMDRWTHSMQGQMETQRKQLRTRSPRQLAHNSGATWKPTDPDSGILSLLYLQQPLIVTVPDYSVSAPDGNEASTMTQALVTAYLLSANGMPRAGEWIAFRELPNGMFYHQAFTGYTGGLLVRTLGNNLEAFTRGAQTIGGYSLPDLGDAAFEFQVFPMLWLAGVYWLGDEEEGFSSQASVLFDRAAQHYMITDGLAIIGSQLIRRILAGVGD